MEVYIYIYIMGLTVYPTKIGLSPPGEVLLNLWGWEIVFFLPLDFGS
jgi:hypothetical protein